MKHTLEQWCKITDALQRSPETTIDEAAQHIDMLQCLLRKERKANKELLEELNNAKGGLR